MDNSDLVSMLKGGESLLQSPLADVAPGADHIRPDIDNHVHQSNH